MSKRIIYRSTGTDEVLVACDNIEQAINLFRADCEYALSEGQEIDIDLFATEMSDDQIASLEEV